MDSWARADFVVRSRDGRVVAIVELKNVPHLNAERARRMRRNLLAHGFPSAEFFLIVSQDEGYLWRARSPDELDVPPDRHFSMEPVVQRVMGRHADERLLESQLAVIVASWLSQLASGAPHPQEFHPEQELREAGLVSAMEGASITEEAAV